MIEAWPPLPEPIYREITAIIHRRLATPARFVEGGHPGDCESAGSKRRLKRGIWGVQNNFQLPTCQIAAHPMELTVQCPAAKMP
jgi:hypothetical protein